MTAEEFRDLALNFPGVTERAHMAHPDFRAHGRIFATLGYPDASWGMVKLATQDQQHLVDSHPLIFSPAKGAWGLQGSTMVRLEAAQPDVVSGALELAWQNSAEAGLLKKAMTAAKTRRG